MHTYLCLALAGSTHPGRVCSAFWQVPRRKSNTMMSKDETLDNQWLARALYELGAVSFGDYTLGGSTVNSPVFVNPKLLISNPMALRVAAKLMYQEVTMAQSLLRSKVQTYDVVAGVPAGGLLLATAYSLESSTPLIYPRLKPEGTGPRGVEGRFIPGARALLVDDLITGGSNMLETAGVLSGPRPTLPDAVALVDRDQEAPDPPKHTCNPLVSTLQTYTI